MRQPLASTRSILTAFALGAVMTLTYAVWATDKGDKHPAKVKSGESLGKGESSGTKVKGSASALDPVNRKNIEQVREATRRPGLPAETTPSSSDPLVKNDDPVYVPVDDFDEAKPQYVLVNVPRELEGKQARNGALMKDGAIVSEVPQELKDYVSPAPHKK